MSGQQPTQNAGLAGAGPRKKKRGGRKARGEGKDAPPRVDVQACYRASASTSAGVFASKAIKAGTRVICEQPALTMPLAGAMITGLRTAFDQLSAEDQARIWRLQPAEEPSPQLKELCEEVRPLIASMASILAKQRGERTPEEQHALETSGPQLLHTLQTLRLSARWNTYQFALVNIPAQDRLRFANDQPAAGLFLERARLRHSCAPNCYAAYNPATNCMTVHATLDIQPGDELTASTISDHMYYTTAKDRRNLLLATRGLTCRCEACNPHHIAFHAHEASRAKARTRALHLATFLTRDEQADFDTALHDLHVPDSDRNNTTAPDLDELRRAIGTAESLCAHLKTTGCRGLEQVRWRLVLVQRMLPRLVEEIEGEEVESVSEAMETLGEEARREAEMCLGGDCGGLGGLGRWVRGMGFDG